MSDMSYRQVQHAELSPDCYDGETCDQIKHRWHAFAEGDKDSEYITDPLTLRPEHFPPGTIVSVKEPICPECGDIRCPDVITEPGKVLWPSKCDCGFNWDEWTYGEYS